MIKIFIPGDFDKKETEQYKKGFRRTHYYKTRKAQGKAVNFVVLPKRMGG